MKKLTILLFCFCLTTCYFGQNESYEEIVKNFYLAKWDENTWISYTKDDNNFFDTEKISQEWSTIRMCGYAKALITFVKYMP